MALRMSELAEPAAALQERSDQARRRTRGGGAGRPPALRRRRPGAMAVLTPVGVALLEQAAPIHVAWGPALPHRPLIGDAGGEDGSDWPGPGLERIQGVLSPQEALDPGRLDELQ